MKVTFDIFVIVVACFAAYLVYVLTEQAFRKFSAVHSPKPIAFAVSMLTLLAIVELGRGVVVLLLMPYAALGMALVALYLLRLFAGKTHWKTLRALQQYLQSLRRTVQTLIRRTREQVRDLRFR